MRTGIFLACFLAAGTARAAVPEGQPGDPAFPQHRSYRFGSEGKPYRLSFHAGSWLTTTDDYYLYEPRRGQDTPTSAPVVLLLPGFVVDGPWQFDRLIRHLTRSGMTVVYPTYLNVLENVASFDDWLDRSSASLVHALAALDGGGHVPVQRDEHGAKLAIVAHSIGSYVASFLAERAAVEGSFPAPRALVFLDPAGHDFKALLGIDTGELGHIAPDTDVIMLSAEDALLDSKGQLDENTQYAVADLGAHLPVDCGHLSSWVVSSDAEGDVQLISDHYDGPQTHRVFDAVDWWGYWPPLSAHLAHAFWGTYGKWRHAGGLHAGHWLDDKGTPLRPIAPRWAHPLGYVCP